MSYFLAIFILKGCHLFRKDRHVLACATLWEAHHSFMGREEDHWLPEADWYWCAILPDC